MKRIKSDRIIVGENIVAGYVYFENGKVVAVSKEELPYEEQIDVTGMYVAPGFIDIHTHGGNGYDFAGTKEEVINGCNFHLKHGTTSICPTISAAPFQVMRQAVVSIQEAMKDDALQSNIIGAHMEGPYLSKEQCGAQCPTFITPPCEEEYQELIEQYGPAIARWSYAPENDSDGRFGKYLMEHQIVPSAGHTNATYKDMQAAIANGCNLVTHLYSCTSTITRVQGFRQLGVIETAFLEDDMFVEIIADGKHLPPELIRLILKVKGTDKIALVTDSLSLAGTDKTHGFMMNTEYIIEDGVCKLADRSAFAGSIATADRLIRVLTREVNIPLVEAVKMMTEVPANIMHLNKGRLEKDRDADIVVFDEDIIVHRIFVNGEEMHRA